MSRIRRIEVNFAVPVEMPDADFHAIHDIVAQVLRSPENQSPTHHHWIAGIGSRMRLQCQNDQRLLGVKPPASAVGI